ncbi:MAG: hypothetical protein U9Q15_04210 [Patescibacteria group bacterium]|nr:hypothetical protein [Patescibacteria group bacterium]
MIIYQESQAKDCPIAQKIVSQYTDATVLDIKHYKNVFDKQLVIPENEKAILLAKNTGSFALPAPVGYGHAGKGYFLRNTYNCPFSCQYCYLQGAFKHRALTVFVNYDDLKQEIQNICNQYPDEEIWFYASNWSDPLGTEMVTHFCQEFIPFIDSIPNARLEIRSKSNYIDPLVDTIAVSPNTEVCFSLNPQEIIAKYE